MTQICNRCIKNNKCLYIRYKIENIDVDEVDDIFDKYINIHNQKFVFYCIDCQFQIEFKNNIFAKIEINQHFNTDYINIKNYLIFYIDSCRYGNFIFDNIIKKEITMISCRCNITYKYYINSPMSMPEIKKNMVIAKNPQLINLLDRNKKHPLIRKSSHIPF